MSETQTGVRVALAAAGSANVATGLTVLDHLIAELARTARFKLSLEVAPGSADAVAVEFVLDPTVVATSACMAHLQGHRRKRNLNRDSNTGDIRFNCR